MSALKNLAAVRRNITRRIRQALEELQESLGEIHDNLGRQRTPVRVPVRVPVPMRGRMLRASSFPYAGSFGGFRSTRFYTTYTGSFLGFGNMRWRNINGSLMFQNFSSRGQFRLKLFTTFYRAPTLTELLKKRMDIFEERSGVRMQLTRTVFPQSTAMAQVPLGLRLHSLLTQKFHHMVMDLARPAQEPEGCFVDFKIEPKVLIPAVTMMNGEVLAELLANLKHFEQHLVELQADLVRLAELGELPLRFLANANVIRVYFPNCDRSKLEALLVEKNVLSGTVHEDVRNECSLLSSDEVSSVSEFDILSSCNMLALLSGSESSYDDVLSSSNGSDDANVEIFEEESYHWA